MATQQRPGPRPYRDFLTPALHRRFTNAAGLTFLLCYAEAVLIGDISSLWWSWLPIGRAGIRTLLLFIATLAIYILRVAQLHVGTRNTTSSFQTFKQYTVCYSTIQTFGWYLFSAWWFSEVYVWSAPDSANLHWIADGKAYERPRLNERPIYLRVVFFSLAIMQSVIHLVFDYDRVLLPVTKGNVQSTADQRPQILVAPLAQLRALLPGLVQSVLLRSMSMIVLGPLVYSLFLRKTAWSWTLFIAKMLWNLPRSSNPPVIPPYHISLIGRSAYSGFLLVLLWETTNVTFAAYVAQAPLKKEHALTDDSRDPNGSLIAGLRAKKDVPRIFAFWELFYISQRFPNRRKSFFQDIDRKGGATWTQILNICLDEIQGVNIRVIEFHNPPPLAPTPTQQGNPQPLPRLSEPLKQGNVFTNSPAPSTRIEKVQSSVSNVAKWVAQNQTHTSKPPSSPRVTKLLTDGRDKVLSKEHQRQLTPQGIKAQVTTYMLDFLRSPLGVPFHQTLQRRIAAVILGTPYGDLGTILDSIDILTRLAICSLTEDPYGRVQSDVPTIIRTFTSTIPNLESFKRNMPIHWTDVKYKDEGERSVPEVDIIIASLRGGLRELLKAFGEYAENLGLSMGEMRIARETATVGEGE